MKITEIKTYIVGIRGRTGSSSGSSPMRGSPGSERQRAASAPSRARLPSMSWPASSLGKTRPCLRRSGTRCTRVCSWARTWAWPPSRLPAGISSGRAWARPVASGRNSARASGVYANGWYQDQRPGLRETARRFVEIGYTAAKFDRQDGLSFLDAAENAARSACALCAVERGVDLVSRATVSPYHGDTHQRLWRIPPDVFETPSCPRIPVTIVARRSAACGDWRTVSQAGDFGSVGEPRGQHRAARR
jgi:hypothetical protein